MAVNKNIYFLIFFVVMESSSFAQEADTVKQFSIPISAQHALTLNGYTQFRYLHMEEPDKPDGFDIRRARLDFKGIVFQKFTYRLQVDFGQGNVKLLDATMGYQHSAALTAIAGQFKVPLSLDNPTSSSVLDFVNRSQVVEALVARGKDVIGNHNGRDVGFQVNGSVIKLNNEWLLDYFVGLFNGSGINTVDLNDAKDVAGRFLFHATKGLNIGGSFYVGYDKFGNPSINQKRNRYAGELRYVFNNLVLQGEFIYGEDGPVKKRGYYGWVGYYFLKKKLQLLAKYDFFDPDISSGENASIYYIGGINYFFNSNFKIQANYEVHDDEGLEIENDVIACHLQISF